MRALEHVAIAYWTAAVNVRSGNVEDGNVDDLMAILRNLEFPDSLYRGAVDAMHVALDRGIQPAMSETDVGDLEYALNARDEMEEDRWSEHPHSMQDGEPEVRYLSEVRSVRNG